MKTIAWVIEPILNQRFFAGISQEQNKEKAQVKK